MEITGKIIHALETTSGVSRAGKEWKKRNYVLETMDNYPTKVCFEFFGDRVDQYPLAVGDVVRLSFDIDSHEYNGKWYTTIRGWKAEKEQGGATSAAPASQGYQAPAAAPAPTFTPSADPNDDLPF